MSDRPQQNKHDGLTCDCMLLCEDVTHSSTTAKHTLHGIVGWMTVPEVPCRVGPLALYIRLTNLQNSHRCEITCAHADGESDAIFKSAIPTPPQPDPFGIYTQIAVIPAIEITRPGHHIITLLVNNEPMLYSRFLVKLVQQQEGQS